MPLPCLGLTKDGQAFDVILTGQPPLPRQSAGWRRMERGSEGADGSHPEQKFSFKFCRNSDQN